MTETKKQKLSKPKKTLVLNAFTNGTLYSQIPGIWRHPNDKTSTHTELSYWTQLAKTAERGKLNSIFIADTLTYFDVYKGPNNPGPSLEVGINAPKLDPSIPISAMASVTESIGFGITFSTVSEHPYLLARRLATLDHLTQGRLGWNIVASYLPSVGRQLLNGGELLAHEDRYAQTQEYLEIVYKLLLSSWREDALIKDKSRGVYVDSSRVRNIEHDGKFFKLNGASITSIIPQGFPVIIQAGTSKQGKEFAAKNAEIIFVGSGNNLSQSGESIKEIRQLAQNYGRDPYSIKFLVSAAPILGKTHQEAIDKWEDYSSYANPEGSQIMFSSQSGINLDKYEWDEPFGQEVGKNNASIGLTKNTLNSTTKTTSRRKIFENSKEYTKLLVGTGEEVANIIEEWVELYDIDGFNFSQSVFPESLEDIVEILIPELQKRGLFWYDYPVPNGTFRENLYQQKDHSFLPKDHPGYQYRWTKDESREDFENKLKDEGIL
ncbi:Dibenzothiophene desulfurization enzyme A [Wickerhamomyces ciferrii]|uniref:Dibenzothiophene desulfurization enzyme A n=1 Tax=Wickerhamomyces ciferrii (strain ATCC 14091 / BCRC 22168 / CBS 111 / JCM 3599 / NBRC 0793 / NRRL Y-1031 F-60-10) TaxID=1206466 RepID=K0KIP6_WICCF|nr:Dibenzothiophene desulfurization enzyme A [Wickerhamomyces ciferrii]CCH42861.1 Dibenzothiophene desulfurization enzyme A [Wickerhamomyces ciferrii]